MFMGTRGAPDPQSGLLIELGQLIHDIRSSDEFEKRLLALGEQWRELQAAQAALDASIQLSAERATALDRRETIVAQVEAAEATLQERASDVTDREAAAQTILDRESLVTGRETAT